MNLPNLTQPRSIAALEKWYADQKLPNYQFTRYFIGINYKKARAFGICKDESTGNFIVYSNDSAGKRTLVYDGPSESEAAGIFFEKLNGEVTRHKESLDKDLQKKKKEENPGIMKQAYGGFGGFILKTIKLVFIYLAGAIAVITIMILGARFFSNYPADGYYKYEDTLYYFEYAPGDAQFTDWCRFDSETQDWGTPLLAEDVPAPLMDKKEAKPYFISGNWSEDMGCTDYITSDYYLQSTGVTPK